jgi:hypothetical protein
MASGTITTSRQLTIAAPPDQARQRVQAALSAQGGKVADDGAGLSAKFGSQLLLRLVGGWFIPAGKFPMKATATFSPAGAGTSVTIDVADAMGVGVKAGIKGKYERGVTQLADQLAASLTGA